MDPLEFLSGVLLQLHRVHNSLANEIEKDLKNGKLFVKNYPWKYEHPKDFAMLLECSFVVDDPDNDNLYVLNSLTDNKHLVERFLISVAEKMKPLMEILQVISAESDEDELGEPEG
jgi:hypothetical protein